MAYKAMADSAEKTHDRRLSSNNVYLAINGGVAGLYAFLIKEHVDHPERLLAVPCIFGVLACVLWILTLNYYRSLAAAKYELLGEFEVNRSIMGYQREWQVFSRKHWMGRWGLSLSAIEIAIAAAALAGHIAVYATFGLNPALFRTLGP